METRKSIRLLKGMQGFVLLWVGQFISIFATRMTNFAITLWAWDLTGTATGLILVGVIGYLPGVLLSPFAGTLIDRWNRKLVLALSDAGAALSTIILLILFYTGKAEIWHLYLTSALASAFGAFQYPAYAAVVTTIVPKEHYARANAMRAVVGSASGIAAPMLAGALLLVVDIYQIMLIDLATFALAMVGLLFVFIPQPEKTQELAEGNGGIWQETRQGISYILDRKSLTAIFLLFTASNIHAGFGYPLMTPMILAKTGDSSLILGMTRSAASVGFMVGGLIMSSWGGPKKRIHAVNLSFILWGVLGAFIFGPAWTIPFWLIGSFTMAIFNPIINSAYIAILQEKVAPDLQGRIFGLENAITTISFPFGQLLADRVFEPALSPGGSLASTLGVLMGTGPGAGIGFVIFLGGMIAIINGIAGYSIKPIREIESILPDHQYSPAD